MKILFVSSGNKKNSISPIVKNQGLSLEKIGCELMYFTIQGKGVWGYLKNIPRLRKVLKTYSPDVVHAHYSLCGFVATLAGARSAVVSLMGSDVKSATSFKNIIKVFSKWYWGTTVVKSQDMKESLGLSDVEVIPNGVNLDRFTPLDKVECQNKLAWNINRKHILFAASPSRPEKNFILAKKAFNTLPADEYDLHYLNKVPNELMPYYHNAADVVLLSSLWEGSPNVVKEAMACNRPVVSTDVGDVKRLFEETKGLYISEHDPEHLASQMKLASADKSSNGRERLQTLGLSSTAVAAQLVQIYNIIR